jgi:hypothetical protein
MTVTNTARPILSDVLKGCDDFDSNNAIRYNFSTVTVTINGATTVVDNLGKILYWDAVNSIFKPLRDETYAEIVALVGPDSPLPDGALIGVSVGDYSGVGSNFEDTDLSVASTKMTVLFRGGAAVLEEGLDFALNADAASFITQLEKQRIVVINDAPESTPTYI